MQITVFKKRVYTLGSTIISQFIMDEQLHLMFPEGSICLNMLKQTPHALILKYEEEIRRCHTKIQNKSIIPDNSEIDLKSDDIDIPYPEQKLLDTNKNLDFSEPMNGEEIEVDMKGKFAEYLKIQQLLRETTKKEVKKTTKMQCERSILPDLNNLDLPEDIKKTADDIFKRLDTKTRRGGKRQKLLFFCCFGAYRELGKTPEPADLASKIGISTNEITKAFSLFSQVETGYGPEMVKTTPISFLKKYFIHTHLSHESYPLLCNTAAEIFKKDSFDQFHPQNVAAALIIYFMDINGIKYNKSFFKLINISEQTLLPISKKIGDIHNS